MNIFFSWSGDLSKNIAEYFSKWLPCVLQSVKPFFSPEIKKGDRWAEKIASELQNDSYCLIFLTRDNLDSKYVHYEAGAISKHAGDSKVWTVLVGLVPGDIEEPLSIFQHTVIEKEDVYKLIKTINNESIEPLSEDVLHESYDSFWPKLEKNFHEILSTKKTSNKPTRSERDLLYEILDLTRGLANAKRDTVNSDNAVYETILKDLTSLVLDSFRLKYDKDELSNQAIRLLYKYRKYLPFYRREIVSVYEYSKYSYEDSNIASQPSETLRRQLKAELPSMNDSYSEQQQKAMEAERMKDIYPDSAQYVALKQKEIEKMTDLASQPSETLRRQLKAELPSMNDSYSEQQQKAMEAERIKSLRLNNKE